MISSDRLSSKSEFCRPSTATGHVDEARFCVLTAVVERVYPSPVGGAILSVRDTAGTLYRVVARREVMPEPPVPGEVWSLEGSTQMHPQYGSQLIVRRAVRTQPSGRLLFEYLVRLKIGIGRTKATRLREAFGDDLTAILEAGDSTTLMNVLSQKETASLLRAWAKCSAEIDVIRFLNQHGFSLHLARKVLSFWGEVAITKLQENPYRLLALAHWGEVDAMGHALGIANDDSRRLVAATEAVLYDRLERQHTWTGRETLKYAVGQVLGSNVLAEQSVSLAYEMGAAVEFNNGIQPVGAALLERAIEARFRSMLQETDQRSIISGTLLRQIIDDAIERFESDNGIRLSDEQRSAVVLATHAKRLVVITGGAGVGKTTVLAAICRTFEAMDQRPLLMALSGRATQRLREATGTPAITIAAFLAAAVKGRAVGTDPVVILDEASMIDLPLMHRLLRALPPSARLLLVGDPHQLPPIGFGLVFQIAVASPSIPRIELRCVHRQAQVTGIPIVAAAIRNGKLPQLASYHGKDSSVSFVETVPGQITDTVMKIAAELNDLSDTQILCTTKMGDAGTTRINERFHNHFVARTNHVAGTRFVVGEPIIFLRNDYKRGLFNGSLGRVLQSAMTDGTVMICEFDGSEHKMELSDLANIALAYSITVHKAQGSQFRRVIIPVVASRLLDRTLIYTAITRGTEQVILVGDLTTLTDAIIAEPAVARREVAFRINV